MSKQTTALNEAIERLGKSAHGTGQDMEALNKSVFSYGKALFSVGVYEAVLKPLGAWAVEQVKNQKKLIEGVQERLVKEQQRLDNLVTERKRMLELGTFDTNALKHQKMALDLQKFRVHEIQEEAKFKTGIISSFGPFAKLSLAVGGVTLFWTEKMVRASHELNRALISTDSSLANRTKLMNKVLDVQHALGADTQTMAEAAKALVEHGAHLGPAFGQSLKTVIMLRDGLGVAVSTGAELVTIFTRQLKTGAEAIGNVMAQVAHQTGLSAERAAQFAIEIGKSLRLLGPGFRSEATGVTRVIAGLAGRINELGGNAQSVITLFRRMSGGTSEAFFLRGLSGVRPGQLGTAGGAETAMKNFADRIKSIITAPEGTEMYVAQLEAVAEMTGVAANDVVDFQQAMKELNKPLTEAQSLAKAYRDQTALVGESWKQMREALSSLMTQALLPVIRYIQPVVRGIADFAKWLSQSEGLVDFLSVAVPVAAGVALFGITKLTASIIKLALTSEFAANSIGGRAILGSIRSVGTVFKKIATDMWLTREMMGMRPGVGASLTASSFKSFGLLGSVGMVAMAGLAGAAVGTFIDRKWPDNTLSKIARTLFTWHYESRQDRNVAHARYSSGPAAARYREDAAKALAAYSAGKIQKDEFDKAVNRAVVANRAYGTEQQTKTFVATLGKQYAESQVYLGQMRRTTVKTKGDQAQDQVDRATLDNLQIQADQLLQQKKIGTASAAQAEAAQAQVRAAIAARDAALFDSTALGDATNRASYRH